MHFGRLALAWGLAVAGTVAEAALAVAARCLAVAGTGTEDSLAVAARCLAVTVTKDSLVVAGGAVAGGTTPLAVSTALLPCAAAPATGVTSNLEVLLVGS